MKKTPFFIVLIVLLTCSNCKQNSNESQQENNVLAEDIPHIFEHFESFPEFQYRTIQLGQNRDALLARLANLPAELIQEEEAYHFRFPSDSAQVIIHDTPVVTEFKVFLKGKYYLNHQPQLQELFESYARKVERNAGMIVYDFKNTQPSFKLTWFIADNSIRLHFILTESHS